MKIKIASYKNSKSFFGGLIRFKQKWISGLKEYSRFSHSEIVFCYNDDEDVLNRVNKAKIQGVVRCADTPENRKTDFRVFGLWFSSSEIDGGTRFKYIADNKNNWEFTEINVSKEKYLKALDYAIKHNGKKYNTIGIIGDQVLGVKWFRKLYKGKKFCSQISCEIMQILGYFVLENGIDIMPGELAKMSNLKFN